ncbi:MAG: hypothetical protein J6W27_01180 [Alphaproteobacteria bacterium]|nr:hypothetical protein [Alphaproteobacteria bacterium]
MKLLNELKSFSKKHQNMSAQPEHDTVNNAQNIRDLCLKYWQDYLDETNKRADLIQHYYGKPAFSSSEEFWRGLQEHLDLAELDESCTKKRDRALQFFRQHPEAWQPGDEIGYFYDVDELQRQIKNEFNVELEYMRPLLNHIGEIDAKLKNKNADVQSMEDLQNERYYYVAVLDDARKTLGDKIQEMWWNAIPEVIKQKYAKSMDDKMVAILAENDDLGRFVRDFDGTDNNLKACRRFVKTLEKEFNERIFKGSDQKVRFAIATRKDFNCNGNYDGNEKKIAVRFNDFAYYPIDELINTIKHECLGHHVDNVCPTLGLQGHIMQDFIEELFNGKLITHGTGPRFFATAKSPLLKQHYCVDGMTEEEKAALAAQGWFFFKKSDAFEFAKYRAIFTERSAFSLEQTGDYMNKINAYRKQQLANNMQNTK